MPPRKRAASTVLDEPRRSRRISASAKTSRYFEGDDESDDPLAGRSSGSLKTKKSSAGKRKVEEEEVVSDEYQEGGDPNEQDEGEDYEDDKKGEASEDENENEDDDEDDEMVSKVTVVKLKGLRKEGDVKYADEYVHENTKLFLKDLKANNVRAWLKNNDREYRRALKDWETFVMSFTSRLSDLDFTVPELPAKHVVFRIYRDTRFSKDPTPYKPHFSAAWSRTGRKGPFACYYIHAEPGSCFVGGGLWHPENEKVYKIRDSIDERPRRWRRILNEPELKKHFLPSAAKSSNPDVALKAFAEKNKENAMKARPKGISADHRDLAMLKLRNYTLGKKVPDSTVFGPGAPDKLVEILRPMVPFVSFLNSIVMPDPNVDEDDSGDDEEEEGDQPAESDDDVVDDDEE